MLQSLQRLGVQGELSFGDQGGRTGAIEHFFKEAAAAASDFLNLGDAESLAALEEARLLVQDLGQNRDGIIELLPVQGCLPFSILLANGPRDLVQIFSGMGLIITAGRFACKGNLKGVALGGVGSKNSSD